MYARPATWCDACTRLTYASSRAPSAVSLAVTSVHDPPVSLVTCTRPSLVPTQMTPAVSGDSEIDEIANQGMPPGRPPSDSGRILLAGLVLRSGLISAQWSP